MIPNKHLLYCLQVRQSSLKGNVHACNSAIPAVRLSDPRATARFVPYAPSPAQPSISATSLIVVPFADVPQARGVTIDAGGNLFSISRSTGIVYKITPTGQISTVVDLPDGDEGYVGPIIDPTTGNLFVSRYMRRTGTEILKITPAGMVSVFASPVVNPSGMALDGQGNLFVSSDTNPGTVAKITGNGSVSEFATGLNHPDGLAIGQNGDLFIGDRGTNRVMRVSASGGQATVFATGLANPMDVEFDQAGRLFVANFDTGTIAIVDSSGAVSPFVSGLTYPAGLAFDQDAADNLSPSYVVPASGTVRLPLVLH